MAISPHLTCPFEERLSLAVIQTHWGQFMTRWKRDKQMCEFLCLWNLNPFKTVTTQTLSFWVLSFLFFFTLIHTPTLRLSSQEEKKGTESRRIFFFSNLPVTDVHDRRLFSLPQVKTAFKKTLTFLLLEQKNLLETSTRVSVSKPNQTLTFALTLH